MRDLKGRRTQPRSGGHGRVEDDDGWSWHYDYKAMAAGILGVLAGGEEHKAICFPWSRRNFCIYRILDAMMREGFFSSLVFRGGTVCACATGPQVQRGP